MTIFDFGLKKPEATADKAARSLRSGRSTPPLPTLGMFGEAIVKTIHPFLCVLAVVALFALFAILFSPLIFHDSIARRNTVYSTSFAEAAFKRIQQGDSRDAVVAALGAPLSRHYILRYPGDSYNSHPAVPPEQLPEHSSIHWEILGYSRSKNTSSDFRLLEVALDATGVVAFTRDYATD